eukprot:TRINITY_DN365_c0_g1_i1.p1 TRINITY_DN365_c0_g1~~TRINITY_DN365_c0_g1_i1.p1  ORF type:complete len:1766 (-),score=259.62 TRINITY_DN365_c0_g1_i1:1103-6400(-)
MIRFSQMVYNRVPKKSNILMQIKYLKNLNKAVDGMQKISTICWSPNNKRLAVATADRYIHLFDENGNAMEKFPTKPSIKGQKSYVVRCLQFSPDNQKLAVAQSDNIVFIYKLGLEWNDKKSIINKYEQSSSVTCMCWPGQRLNEIIFGLAEGKVRVGHIKKQYKSESLYGTASYVVSIAASPDGQSIISGHLDHSIIRMNLERKEKVQIVQHSSIPYALDWGAHIMAAGNDQLLTFYDENGSVIQKFDYTSDDAVKEFTVANFNPSGESVAVGNFNKFFVYTYNPRRKQWDETTIKKIENYYSISAISWKKDGSKLVTGSLCGSVDMFDICMKVSRYKGKFEFTHVSPSQVIVKKLDTGERAMMKSSTGNEISKLKIYRDRYVVGQTVDTLLLCDLDNGKMSEIPWRGSGNEKFDFSSPNVCMIFNAGELSIIEYGLNEIIGTCRTEYLSPYLISARLNYAASTPTRIIAYLFDLQTIRIQDITNTVILATLEHDSRIDYLALNQAGTKLIFRDKRKQLHLFSIKEQTKSTLLNFCSYVNWVPGTDVVVAQNKNTLCVWYSIDQPDKVTMYTIKGDVEGIEKVEGKTSVVVDCGNSSISYPLDENLIKFGMAVEKGELEKAADILEPLELSVETEANWKTLAKIALERKNLIVAERCYSALGNIPRAKYLHGINKLIRQFEEKTKSDGSNFYLVQSKLAVLDKDFHRAEAILLGQNEVEEAMEMYQELHKWDESIRLAEKKNHPDVKELKTSYIQWLLQTNQEAKAAEVKEREGDYITAINLYLKGGLPAKAAAVVNNYNMSYEQDILEKIATALTNAGLHEKAGDFFEKMGMYDRALDSYKKGHAYHKAVDIARKGFPHEVVKLEEQWGDWLVEQKQVEASINHFIEAGLFNKAIEASVIARQWNKAIQLLRNQPPEVARPFYKQIAKHYADVRQYDLAEKHYINAGEYIDAFEMYVKANKWDAAYKMVSQHLPESEVSVLYITEGQKYEKEQSYKEAERMYLTVNEPDMAITMYKRARQYDNMIRLVIKYRRDLLKETHLHLAKQLEKENSLKQAEHHYIEGGDWNQAVEMYRSRDMWEEAIRVAKSNGTAKDLAEIAKKWAQTMERDQGVKLLTKLGLVEAAVDLLCDKKEFTEAFRLADTSAKYKQQDVHLKYALHLEDEQRYKEAEEHFIKANKTSEAICMYEHLEDWHSALQVARQFAPESVSQVYVDQAKFYLKKQDMAKAEAAFINAKHPDMAINEYLQRQMWTEALRVAKKYAPHLASEINSKLNTQVMAGASVDDLLASAKMWEDSKDFSRAIDTYLQIDQSNYKDLDQLEAIWDRAVNLSIAYEKERAQDVIVEVGKRLEALRRYASAGELYENAGFYESAVTCYLTCQQWDKARDVAGQIKNPEQRGQLAALIEKAYKQHLIETGQFGGLVDHGDVSTGLTLLAQKGEWDECLMLASKQSADVFNHYLLLYAKTLIGEGHFKEAAEVFVRYKCPLNPANFAVYKTLALEILADAELNDAELLVLKQMMIVLCNNLNAQGASETAAYNEFYQYAVIAHLELLKAECKALNLQKCYAKACISLLRYTKEIRVDKAFLDAGLACKDMKQYSMAFMFLNRYLDLAEAIEETEGANALQDNTDFNETDIPSAFDTPLPEKNLLPESKRDEIKDWVLQLSVQQKVEQRLNTKPCDQCGAHVYEASLTCPKCRKGWEPCIASGYPLPKQGIVHCKSCQKGALKEYWTEYVKATQHCPWCKNVQSAFQQQLTTIHQSQIID